MAAAVSCTIFLTVEIKMVEYRRFSTFYVVFMLKGGRGMDRVGVL